MLKKINTRPINDQVHTAITSDILSSKEKIQRLYHLFLYQPIYSWDDLTYYHHRIMKLYHKRLWDLKKEVLQNNESGALAEFQAVVGLFRKKLPLSVWYNIAVILSDSEDSDMFIWLKENYKKRLIKSHLQALKEARKETKRFGERFKITRYNTLYHDQRRYERFKQYYQESMETINIMISTFRDEIRENPNDISELDYIDFMIDVIKNDIKYDALNSIYHLEHEKVDLLPFPMDYIDPLETNIKKQEKSIITSKQKGIDFSKDTVFSLPYNQDKLPRAFIKLSNNKFNYDKGNHKAYYYKELDFAYVYNGHHSTTLGIYKKQGLINATVIELEGLFENVYTDGAFWYDKHTNETMIPLDDFRFGILFELAKKKV